MKSKFAKTLNTAFGVLLVFNLAMSAGCRDTRIVDPPALVEDSSTLSIPKQGFCDVKEHNIFPGHDQYVFVCGVPNGATVITANYSLEKTDSRSQPREYSVFPPPAPTVGSTIHACDLPASATPPPRGFVLTDCYTRTENEFRYAASSDKKPYVINLVFDIVSERASR